MGGITNLRSHALRDGPHGRGLALAGLYDVPEEHHVRRGLLAAGVLVTGGVGSADIELAEVGFHACDRDLEDELLRAVEGALNDILNATEVPAANEEQCGWGAHHSLEGAQEAARAFLGAKDEWLQVMAA